MDGRKRERWIEGERERWREEREVDRGRKRRMEGRERGGWREKEVN